MPLLTTLGTGVFIGSSQALAVGGPASLLISYLVLSLLTYCMTTTAAEVASHLPVRDGTLVTHCYRYASRHFGFATAYLRWYTLALFVPYEITAAMVNLGFWEPGLKVAGRISIGVVLITAANFLPEKAFRRSEILFTGVKLFLMVGLLGFSIALFATGHHGARGFEYWSDPGAMNEQLTGGHLGRAFGVAQCLLYSAIAFVFVPEQVVYRAEQKDLPPRTSFLSMCRRDSMGIFALYMLSVLGMGVVCPSDDPLLTNNDVGAGYSPYIVAIRIAAIEVLPTIVTATILLSCLASGRAFLFLSSRTLHSLAEHGHAPLMFMKQNRYGVPYAAVLASGAFSFSHTWYLSWVSSSAVYVNFRRLAKAERAEKAANGGTSAQPFGAYIGMVFSLLLPLANGLTVASPDRFNIRNLIPTYIGIPVFLVLYYGHQVLSSGDPEARTEEASLDRVSVRAGPSRAASHWFGQTRANAADLADNRV
ncbi:Amino acid permease [Aspergillus sp. HF37]|nr:Amino acid permease [Aspergillus sp. HF37]